MPTKSKKDTTSVYATSEVEVVFDGVTYKLPPPKRWPLEAQKAEEENKMYKFVAELLGEEQVKKFEKKKRDVGDLEHLIKTIFEAVSALEEVEEGE